MFLQQFQLRRKFFAGAAAAAATKMSRHVLLPSGKICQETARATSSWHRRLPSEDLRRSWELLKKIQPTPWAWDWPNAPASPGDR